MITNGKIFYRQKELKAEMITKKRGDNVAMSRKNPEDVSVSQVVSMQTTERSFKKGGNLQKRERDPDWKKRKKN